MRLRGQELVILNAAVVQVLEDFLLHLLEISEHCVHLLALSGVDRSVWLAASLWLFDQCYVIFQSLAILWQQLVLRDHVEALKEFPELLLVGFLLFLKGSKTINLKYDLHCKKIGPKAL